MSDSRMFRYSRWDALSVAVIPFQTACFFALALAYGHLSGVALLALAPAMFALSLQSSGANHNHYHTPIFRARWLNALARIGFSMIGNPKTPHNIGHGMHHATAQSWNEASILEMLGLKRPLHRQLAGVVMFVFESFGLKYFMFMVLLKVWPLERVAAFAAPKEQEVALRIFRKIKEPAALRATQLDLAAWLGLRIALCVIDWQFFLFYFIPVQFVVETLRQSENYLQHWGASDAQDSKRDSVSCYGTVYNWLTFNLGYHQEHHFRPGTHWLDLPKTRAELPAERRTVPFTHYVNLPVFYPAFAAELARSRAANANAVPMDAPQGEQATVPR